MYELIGARGAGSVVVEGLLELAGAPYTKSEATPWEPGADVSRLRSLNPLVQVPVLVLPDGTVLTESGAMVLHLADRFPEAGIAPAADDPTRPAFLRWLIFMVANVYATFAFGDDPKRWVSGEEAQKEYRHRTDEYRKRLWTILEEQAAAAPWFLGERFSALDLYVATMSHWRPGKAWFAAHCPRLHAIAAAAEADPRLAPVMARNF